MANLTHSACYLFLRQLAWPECWGAVVWAVLKVWCWGSFEEAESHGKDRYLCVGMLIHLLVT